MQIRCNKCGREMCFMEGLGYVQAFLINVMKDVAAKFFIQALENYFLNPPRGVLDKNFSGVANGLNLQCPRCGNKNCWDPAPTKNKAKKKKRGQDQAHV
jgi:hypothetical protein